MFHRISQRLRGVARNVSDSFRFMSISDRRLLYYGFSTLTATSLTGVYAALNTTQIEVLREYLQMYKYRMPLAVSVELYEMLHSALEDTGIQSSSIGLFNFIGCDPYSFGNLSLPTGAYIGLPYQLSLSLPTQIDPSDLRFLGQFKTKMSSTSPLIKRLTTALILSANAKLYVFAHEISLVTSNYFYLKCFNIFTFTLGTLLLMNRAPKMAAFAKRATLIRATVAVTCLLLSCFTGLAMDQMLDYVYDLRAMRAALANTGPEYRLGAIEYYEKLIERNKCLHELIGGVQGELFTADGDARRLFGLVSQSYQTHLGLLRN